MDSQNKMIRVVRKPAFCICKNKDADQLHGNREADQRLCFRYKDSTISLLPKYEISSLQPSSVAVQPDFMWDLVGIPEHRFSHNETQIKSVVHDYVFAKIVTAICSNSKVILTGIRGIVIPGKSRQKALDLISQYKDNTCNFRLYLSTGKNKMSHVVRKPVFGVSHTNLT